jgi:hypothetical protein
VITVAILPVLRPALRDIYRLAHDAEHRLTHEMPKLRMASIHA